MKRYTSILLLVPTVTALFAIACSDDDAPNTAPDATAGSSSGGESNVAPPAVCEVLGTLCHAADSGPSKVGECHDVGHVGDEVACQAQFSSCIAACLAPEEGTGGASTAPFDNPHCRALGELCHFLDDQATPTAECHEVGHTGNEPDCIAAFDTCAPLCIAKREAEPSGHDETGGAGGMTHGSDGDGTHAEGGAGGSP